MTINYKIVQMKNRGSKTTETRRGCLSKSSLWRGRHVVRIYRSRHFHVDHIAKYMDHVYVRSDNTFYVSKGCIYTEN